MSTAQQTSAFTGNQHGESIIKARLRKMDFANPRYKLPWLKKFRVDDTRFAYVIHRFVVRDTNGVDWMVNAEATTDWRNPVLEQPTTPNVP